MGESSEPYHPGTPTPPKATTLHPSGGRNPGALGRVLGRMELFSGLLSSLGLSGAAGLNAYIPLLVVGLLTRSGLMNLAQPFDLLANPWVLLGIAVLGLLDFVGDKIPGVDHALHLVGGVVNTAAGAVLFAAQSGVAAGVRIAAPAACNVVARGGQGPPCLRGG